MPNIPWTARDAGIDGCSGRIPFNGSIRRCWLSCLIFSDGIGQHTARDAAAPLLMRGESECAKRAGC